jgi:hypothetical protein
MGAGSCLANMKYWKKHENYEKWLCGVEDKCWHFRGTSVLIYCTASQKNHTTLSYFCYNKVLSHNYWFAVKGPLIYHTEPPLLSVWNPFKLDWGDSDPLARTSSSWVWGRRNILITLWTMNLQDRQSKRTHSSFGIKWGISCSQNATDTFKIQKDCPQGANTFSTLIQHML